MAWTKLQNADQPLPVDGTLYILGGMAVFLEILTGTEKGMVYRVRPGLKVGSATNCDLRLDNQSVPPTHSQVLLDHKDQMVLVCTNAVYESLVNGQSVKKVTLLNGVQFQIGSATLKVIHSDKKLPGVQDPLRPQRPSQTATKKSKEPNENQPEAPLWSPQPVQDSPRSRLIEALQNLLEENENPLFPISFQLFKTPFSLKVCRGPQSDDEYIVSWGPRDFGPFSLEFPIEYPPLPDILFSLRPNSDGDIEFYTEHPEFSKVSGKNKNPCVIEDGDRIHVGDSELEVSFLKDLDSHG